jgi:hypothetical protein
MRHRIFRHRHELSAFRDEPRAPVGNNPVERDIRRTAAARSGGTSPQRLGGQCLC